MARTTGPEVQAVPPRGHEAVPQGRALPDREVRHRAPLVPARPARPRADEAVASTSRSCARSRRRSGTTACSRSSSATTTRRRARKPASPVRTCCACSSCRLDNVVYRLGFAASRAQAPPARAPRPLPRERPARQHPVLPASAPTTCSRCAAARPPRPVDPRCHRSHRLRRRLAAGRPRQPDRQGAAPPDREEIDTPVQEQLIVELYSK